MMMGQEGPGTQTDVVRERTYRQRVEVVVLSPILTLLPTKNNHQNPGIIYRLADKPTPWRTRTTLTHPGRTSSSTQAL
jgi:hypothetical protein